MAKPDDIEIRNPRYAGATIGDLVRALVRPRKPKGDTPDEAREESPGVREERVRYQRKK